MKQGTLIYQIVAAALALALAGYVAFDLWRGLRDPFSTALSYGYTVYDSLEATGYLVRSEQVLPAAGGQVDLIPAEGEKVSRGQTVARIYQDEDVLARSQQIQALEQQLEQVRSAQRSQVAGQDSARLGQEIIRAMVALRASVAAGDLTGLESQAGRLRSLVYQRGYTYGGAGQTGDMDSVAAALERELADLRSWDAGRGTAVTTPVSGIFSGVVDGYEGVITPENITALTPGDLDKLTPAVVPEQPVGKLIVDATWYFVCSLPEEQAQALVPGRTVTVRFSLDWSGEVDMSIQQVGSPQGGRSVVILSSDRYLSKVTLLRRQTVDLIFSSTTGIRVPTQAIRTVTRTETQEDGNSTTTETQGVYALVGAQAEFKPVKILRREDHYCLVQPEETGRKALRAGDEIIVASEDLFDGKVIRSYS